MEQEKKKLTLKDLIAMSKADNVIFSRIFGDDNGNYNMFKIYRDPNKPFITQEIYDDNFNHRVKP